MEKFRKILEDKLNQASTLNEKIKTLRDVVKALYDIEANVTNNYGRLAGECAEYLEDNKITENLFESDLYKLKEYYYNISDSIGYADDVIAEIKALNKSDVALLGIDVKKEMKIFKDIQTLFNKSDLGVKL